MYSSKNLLMVFMRFRCANVQLCQSMSLCIGIVQWHWNIQLVWIHPFTKIGAFWSHSITIWCFQHGVDIYLQKVPFGHNSSWCYYSLPPCERQQLHVRSLVRMISYRGDTSWLTALQLDTKTSLSSVSYNETSHFSLLTLRGDSDTKASLCHDVGWQ